MATTATRSHSSSKKKSSTRAGKYVREEMHERKRGSSPHVQSRKQAIAVGLSKARRAGVRVPKKKRGS